MRELDEEGFAIRPNKTQLKRELAAVRTLVVQLLELPDGEWSRLALNETTRNALREAKGMKASGAKNRLLKHIVNQLVKQDLSGIEDYFREKKERAKLETRRFHRLEEWRDRLLEEGDEALQAFMAEYPASDRQQLRQLLRAAQREQETGKPAGAGRKLFRALRDAAENK